jgi:hypothetical protein
MDKEKLLAALQELQTLGERGVRGEDLADKIRALIRQIEGSTITTEMPAAQTLRGVITALGCHICSPLGDSCARSECPGRGTAIKQVEDWLTIEITPRR